VGAEGLEPPTSACCKNTTSLGTWRYAVYSVGKWLQRATSLNHD
jgi:hypothetical protein